MCVCRQALAAKGPKGATPATPEEDPRTVLKMTQKFSRKPEVPADQDVAKQVFDIANGQIRSDSAPVCECVHCTECMVWCGVGAAQRSGHVTECACGLQPKNVFMPATTECVDVWHH